MRQQQGGQPEITQAVVQLCHAQLRIHLRCRIDAVDILTSTTQNQHPDGWHIGAQRWLLVGARSICMACWIAFGLGIVMDVSRSTLVILVTVAAVATEGVFWGLLQSLG